MDDTHSLLDGWYVMSLCFPYINANFKHRSGRNIPRDMSFFRGNARTLRVHRHADLEETRLEKDKPNEKKKQREFFYPRSFRVLNITLMVDSFQIRIFSLFRIAMMYLSMKSVREKDEIAGYTIGSDRGSCNPRYTSIQHAEEKSDEWLSKLVAWEEKCVITADYAISN